MNSFIAAGQVKLKLTRSAPEASSDRKHNRLEVFPSALFLFHLPRQTAAGSVLQWEVWIAHNRKVNRFDLPQLVLTSSSGTSSRISRSLSPPGAVDSVLVDVVDVVVVWLNNFENLPPWMSDVAFRLSTFTTEIDNNVAELKEWRGRERKRLSFTPRGSTLPRTDYGEYRAELFSSLFCSTKSFAVVRKGKKQTTAQREKKKYRSATT